MGITDKSKGRANTRMAVTDTIIATKIEDLLANHVGQSRATLKRINGLMSKAPGGKAGVIAAMGASDATEAQAIIAKILNIVNTHKAEFTDGVADPLI